VYILYTQIGPYKDISKKVVRVTTMWLCDERKKKKYNKFSLWLSCWRCRIYL